jgi:glycine/D-amino acid oxidase-like deaminating enzyme
MRSLDDTVRTVVIGGGLSALVAANQLARLGDDKFLIAAGPRNGIGGFASWGAMKIGLPPAGSVTREWVGSDFYDDSLSEFLNEFRQTLEYGPFASDGALGLSRSGLSQKSYFSFLLFISCDACHAAVPLS